MTPLVQGQAEAVSEYMARQESPQNPFDDMDKLYGEVILDHYRHPRNRQLVANPDVHAESQNLFCGDKVALQFKLRDGRMAETGFHGYGCSISLASASMMTELLKDKTLEEGVALSKLFRSMMLGKELTDEELEQVGELRALSGVLKYPIRTKCALLPWNALEEGVQHYRARHKRQ